MSMTFVLVHGAWHGGWCWDGVAGLLRARGHRVSAPTQSGLAERAHLLSRGITLETFIDDVTGHILSEDARDVVLVGHSFAGSSISGAAERLPDRIRSLIYLDAIIVEAGETPLDQFGPEVRARRLKAANESSGGLSIPVPTAEAMGISDPAQAAWLIPRLTPHPLSTFQSPLPISGKPGAGHRCHYIRVTHPVYAPLEASRNRVWGYGWPIHDIATGHDAMITAPHALAELLIDLGQAG
ncbi:MAG: alpha/beta hydrolase family protein [Pseudomonadota bacterium]